MRTRPIFALVALGLFLSLGCERPDDQVTESLDPVEARQERESFPPELLAQLDSGSAAFREDDFEAALRHYQAVTEIDDEVAAGWFGLFMVHRARGEADQATEALSRAQALAPGASIIHPTPADTAP